MYKAMNVWISQNVMGYFSSWAAASCLWSTMLHGVCSLEHNYILCKELLIYSSGHKTGDGEKLWHCVDQI